MKEVLLTQGKVAIVDDIDYDNITRYKWQFNGYAYRTIKAGNKRRSLRMHRFVMGEAPVGMVTDHINGNKLDNRRNNLRFVTKSMNTMNYYAKSKKKNAKYRGVFCIEKDQLWDACGYYMYKSYHLGRFKSQEDAGIAYNDWATETIGEEAILNKL